LIADALYDGKKLAGYTISDDGVLFFKGRELTSRLHKKTMIVKHANKRWPIARIMLETFMGKDMTFLTPLYHDDDVENCQLSNLMAIPKRDLSSNGAYLTKQRITREREGRFWLMQLNKAHEDAIKNIRY
jgi:hypothetical protein